MVFPGLLVALGFQEVLLEGFAPGGAQQGWIWDGGWSILLAAFSPPLIHIKLVQAKEGML